MNFCGEVIFGIGDFDILIDAAGREAKQEAFVTLGRGGFVDGRVGKMGLIEFDIGGGAAENGFKDLFTILDRAPDGRGLQRQLMH